MQVWLSSEGRPLSSELCETDARSMAARERALWWMPCALAIAIAVGVLIEPNQLAGAAPLILLLMAIKVIFDKHPGKQRSQELNAQAGVEGVAFAEAGGLAWAVRYEKARQRQIREAIQETQGLPAAGGPGNIHRAAGGARRFLCAVGGASVLRQLAGSGDAHPGLRRHRLRQNQWHAAANRPSSGRLE